jgi:hypothetical protein
MESQKSNQGKYHLRFGEVLALPSGSEKSVPYAVTDHVFRDLIPQGDGETLLKFLNDNEKHDDPLHDACLTWWDIEIKFRDADESIVDGGKVRLCFEVKSEVLFGTQVPYTARNFKPPS